MYFAEGHAFPSSQGLTMYSLFKKSEDTLFFSKFLCFLAISDVFTHCRPAGFRYVFVLQAKQFKIQKLQQSKSGTHHTSPRKHITTQEQVKNYRGPKSRIHNILLITLRQTLGIRHVCRSINDDPNSAYSCSRIVIRSSADVGKVGQF